MGRLLLCTARRAIAFALLSIGWPDSTAGAQATQLQRSAAEVKVLYESADYSGALTLAASVPASSLTPQDAKEIQLYEVLCQLALGNEARAQAKLESILQDDPLYQPPADMPNRLLLMTETVRGRLAPTLAQTTARGAESWNYRSIQTGAWTRPASSKAFTLSTTAGFRPQRRTGSLNRRRETESRSISY